jgi:hypothetical protein
MRTVAFFKLNVSSDLLFSLFAKRCGGGRKKKKRREREAQKEKWPNRILYKGKDSEFEIGT